MARALKPATYSRKPRKAKKTAKTSPKKSVVAPLAGVLVMILGFCLLNSQLIAAQIIQRTHKDMPAVQVQKTLSTDRIDGNTSSKLIIPKLGVTAPVIDEPSIQESDIQNSRKKGVIHYANTAYPGQKGNVVIFGHSSGPLWQGGDYKFIFTRLNALSIGSTILLTYNGIQYSYQVTDSVIVSPTDFSVVQKTNEPQLTLITCTPVGTSRDRLVVRARQISPDPKTLKTVGEASLQTVTAGRLPQ